MELYSPFLLWVKWQDECSVTGLSKESSSVMILMLQCLGVMLFSILLLCTKK